jgi:hypothetical protein
VTGDPMADRIAAIRVEIAEDGHHPGPYTLVNEDLLALCDEVDRLRAEMDHLRRVVRAADQMAAENESAARRVTGEAGEARGGVHVEVTRLRAENDRLTAENTRLMEAARL